MSLTTTNEVKALVTVPLSDPDLQKLIDRIEGDLVAKLGSLPDGVTSVTERLSGGDVNVFLKRKIGSISSVVEYAYLDTVTGATLTAGTDFYAWYTQGRLERIRRNWGEVVVVTYVPEAAEDTWNNVVIDLVRLYISRSGVAAEAVTGSHSFTAPENWDREIIGAAKRLRFTPV